MIRITTVLWVLLLTVAAGTVMHVSYQVRHVQAHLTDLGRDIQHEQDAIRILGAEWDTLNEPSRIDALAKRHLTLESTPIQRVVALEDIPFPPSPDQIAAAETGKTARDKVRPRPASPAGPPVGPVARGPAVEARATVAAARPARESSGPLPAAPDGIGLILARIERRE